MRHGQIIYALQGNKTTSERAKDDKEAAKQMQAPETKYHIRIGKTDYYPKTRERFLYLQQLKQKTL